jgi:hypothetical protein
MAWCLLFSCDQAALFREIAMKVMGNHLEKTAPASPGRIPKIGDVSFSNLLEESTKGLSDPGAEAGDSRFVHNRLIYLGEISPEHRTVSNLLVRHPEYGKRTWQIIHSEENRVKPYTRIRSGTKVFLNPNSLEITWAQNAGTYEGLARSSPLDRERSEPSPHGGKPEKDPFSEGLVRAVEPLLGRAYEEIDCFQLVIQGLEKLGVKYRGRGGLGERLMRVALSKGLPQNAYLNGEGLVELTGSSVYAKSFLKNMDPVEQARKVFAELEPLLERGLILSFSTPTRGHTGIISRQGDHWTYINSGRMDHEVQRRSREKGVGEEFLKKEIKNWFRLARERGESLQITVGRLHEEKLKSRSI